MRRKRVSNILREVKAKPCLDCGKSYPFYVMDLDHRPGERKLFNLAHAHFAGKPVPLVEAEIAKCDVVCANCHRERTYQRLSKT